MSALVDVNDAVASVHLRSEAPALGLPQSNDAGAVTEDETGAMLLRIAVWEIIFGNGDPLVLGAQVRALLEQGSRWTTHDEAEEMSASILQRFLEIAKAGGGVSGG